MKRYSLSAVLVILAYMAVLLLLGSWLVIAIWPDSLDTTASQAIDYSVTLLFAISKLAFVVLVAYVAARLLGSLDKPLFKTIPFLLLLGVLAGECMFYIYVVGTALG